MKTTRPFLWVFIGLAELSATLIGRAQAPGTTDGYGAFRLVRSRNVFDPDRSGARSDAPPPRASRDSTAPRSNYVMLTGTMVTPSKTLAFFSGSNSDYNKVISTGEVIANFKLTRINPSDVEFEHAGKPVTVAVGHPVPIEGTVLPDPNSSPPTGDLSPAAATTSAITTAITTTPPSTSAPSADKSEVLRRMMERRQKEMSK